MAFFMAVNNFYCFIVQSIVFLMFNFIRGKLYQ